MVPIKLDSIQQPKKYLRPEKPKSKIKKWVILYRIKQGCTFGV